MSLAGKVNSIKMNVLPKFLYLFRCVPLYLPKSYFKSIDKAFLSFIWDGRNPRVRLELLQRSRLQGGLALPNLCHYYWAANIQKILYWLQDPVADWCQLEATSCISTSLAALVTSSLPLPIARFTNNPMVISTLKIWSQFRKNFGFTNLLHISPICNNHLFPPAYLDSAFSLWLRQGISRFKDLYINSLFANFDDLSHKFGLPRSGLYRFFQIRHCLQGHDPNFPNLPVASGLDDILELAVTTKGLISRIMDCIASLNNITLTKIRADWMRELGEDLEEDIWNAALRNVNGSSSCARLCVIQFKILHRVHFSKARLAKIYPNSDPSCDRCHNTPADLVHMFFSCPSLITYWSMIFKTLSDALNIDFQPNAVTAIFGIAVGKYSTLSVGHKNVVAFTTLLARRRILLHWKSKNPPKVSMWLNDLMHYIQLEKIKYSLRGSRDKFFSVWGLILAHLDNLNSLDTLDLPAT